MRRRSVWYVCVAVAFASLVGCGDGGSTTTPPAGDGGRLQGNLGSDNAGATVRLDGTDMTARVAPDGSFAFDDVPEGEYTLAVESSAGEGGAVLCRIVEGETTEVGEVPIGAGGKISGLVTRLSRQIGPIAGARVTVRRTPEIWNYIDEAPPGMVDDIRDAGGSEGATRQEDEVGFYPPRTVITDADGSFDLVGLPDGPYSLVVEAEGYETGAAGTWVSTGFTSAVDVQLEFIDPNNATVSGTITTEENGQSVPLAYVVVDLWPNELAEPTTRQDDGESGGGDGGEGGDGSDGGEDPADDGDGSGANESGEGEGGGDDVVTTVGDGNDDGETTDDDGGVDPNLEDDPSMPPGAEGESGGGGNGWGGPPEGFGDDGKPSEDMDPWCLPPWRWGKQAMTDENGEFSITNIVPGSYLVNIWRFGYSPVQREITLTERDVETISEVLESILAEVSGTVYGRTEGGSTEPLAGAIVSGYTYVWGPWTNAELDDSDRPTAGGGQTAAGDAIGPENALAETGEDGGYTITVEAGHVWVSAWKDGYNGAGAEFEVTTAGATGVDMILEPWEGGDEPRPVDDGTETP